MTAFGLLRLAINIGMAIGPVIGGVLSGIDYNYLFIGNAAACAAFGLLVLIMLPETRPADSAAATPEPGARRGYGRVFADRSMLLYLAVMFAATFVYTQTTATLPLHVRDVHLSNSFYGLLLGVNAVMVVAIELPLIKVTGRRRPGRVLFVGILALTLGVGLTGIADSRAALLVTVVIWTFGEMIYTPVATTYPGLLAPEHLRGRYQGAEGIAVTLAQTAGPALGGLVYSVSPAASWLACGLVGLAGAAIILPSKDPRQPSRQPAADPELAGPAAVAPADS